MKNNSKEITDLFFWNKVKKCGDNDCWNWSGSIRYEKEDGIGYGQIKRNGKVKYAHRVSYEISKGNIPDGKFVLHLCNNPLCVNPNHLSIGDRKENGKKVRERKVKNY